MARIVAPATDRVTTPESPPQDRYRRAPALYGMLEQKGRHQGGQRQPTLIDRRPQDDTGEGQGGGVGLKGPLDVPLLVKLTQAGRDSSWMNGEVGHPLLGL